jgi:hypothetical protein
VSGFVELFSAPVEAYKRDGRILRGVRKGASAFSNSTAVAALELSGRMFDWIDFAASVTHDMVSNFLCAFTFRFFLVTIILPDTTLLAFYSGFNEFDISIAKFKSKSSSRF